MNDPVAYIVAAAIGAIALLVSTFRKSRRADTAEDSYAASLKIYKDDNDNLTQQLVEERAAHARCRRERNQFEAEIRRLQRAAREED